MFPVLGSPAPDHFARRRIFKSGTSPTESTCVDVPTLRRVSRRLLAALLCAAFSIAGTTAVARAEDAGVRAATDRLETAEDRAAATSRALDDAAASYERASAHLLRLGAEGLGSDAELAAVDAAETNAGDTLRQRIVSAYKHPGTDLVLADALGDAPDAGTAFHRAALFGRLVTQSASQLDGAARLAAMTRGDIRQERIIAAGSRAALVEWESQSKRLRDELAAAEHDVALAARGVTAAKQEAERRRQAAEAARRAAASAGGAPWSTVPPPPSLDGKTCPVGTPNGFIDSWGFPRSGGRSHEGVDMFAPMGTPLYAVADGTIWRVYNNTLGGLAINLIDESGTMYYYAHMSAAHVRSGQQVASGQVIGAVGNSGNALGTPPHVHWQVHPGNDSPVNPFPLAQSLCRG